MYSRLILYLISRRGTKGGGAFSRRISHLSAERATLQQRYVYLKEREKISQRLSLSRRCLISSRLAASVCFGGLLMFDSDSTLRPTFSNTYKHKLEIKIKYLFKSKNFGFLMFFMDSLRDFHSA